MSDKNVVYPVCLIALQKKYYLLWKDGGSASDTFITFENSADIVVTKSLSELHAEANKINYILMKSDPVNFDMDLMMRDLARIGNSPCSTRLASRTLDGWNNIEDLAKSLKVNMSDFGDEVALKKIYDKLFFGNNIPAMAQSDKYHPFFSADERRIMRYYLRGLWGAVAKKMRII